MYFVFLPCIAVLKKIYAFGDTDNKNREIRNKFQKFCQRKSGSLVSNLIGNPVTARHIISM